MNNLKKQNRRSLIKGVATSSLWMTPTLSAISLPVHAMTSLQILEDCTPPPPPTLSVCTDNLNGEVPNLIMCFRNISTQEIDITNITISDQANASTWNVDVPTLPLSLNENQAFTLIALATPVYSCSNGEVVWTIIVTTSLGVCQFERTGWIGGLPG